MKQLTCEMCGSTDLVKQDGVFVCQTCGCKYSTEEAKKLMVEVVGAVKVEDIANRESLLKRSQMFLSEGKFDEANRYFEQVLDIDPECAEAYLGKLMVKYKVAEVDDLVTLPHPIAADEDYKKFARFATDEQREKVQSQYIESICYFMNQLLDEFGLVFETLYTPIETTDEIRQAAKNGLVTKSDRVKNITVLGGVREIHQLAFCGCSSLTSVTIPESVSVIGAMAFKGCSSLTSVTIPESVSVIGDSAFWGCKSLTSVTIAGDILACYRDVFEDCTSLTDIIILDGVKKIYNWGFSGCTSLTSITIPDSVEEISPSLARLIPLCNVNASDKIKKIYEFAAKPEAAKPEPEATGCYVATAVYGSYDCPQVWTLRRFRDYTLAESWYGRAFIHAYYAISPTLVKWFGNTNWFKRMWQDPLDRMVAKLQSEGVESTPYEDRVW